MRTIEEFNILLTLTERVNKTINYKTDPESSANAYLIDRDEFGNLGINIYCLGKHMLNLLRHYNDNNYGICKKLDKDYFINDFYELHKSFKSNYDYTNLLLFFEAFRNLCLNFNVSAYYVVLEIINETCNKDHGFNINLTKIQENRYFSDEKFSYLSDN